MVDIIFSRNGTGNPKRIVLSTVIVDPSRLARFTIPKEHGC